MYVHIKFRFTYIIQIENKSHLTEFQVHLSMQTFRSLPKSLSNWMLSQTY